MARAVSLLFLLVALILFIDTTQAKSSEWWQSTVIYQVYVKSFKDSNGDGIGDLKGLIEKLPYIRGLGVGAICLSPIFRSPMVDNGYDVSDFRAIDPSFGTMNDFDTLLKKAKENDLKVILDFVPNHSSNQHEWFQRSMRRVAPYTDYYIWRDGRPNPSNYTMPLPPNNWLSRYGGSAWEWSFQRHQYYLHTYSSSQPDLNYRYPPVVQEMMDAIKFWLEKGVHGFRMAGVSNLYENINFFDEPIATERYYNQMDYDSLRHLYTTNLNETHDMVAQWRQLVEKFSSKDFGRVLIVDVNADLDQTMAYYGNTSKPQAHFPINNLFLKEQKLNKNSKATEFLQVIHGWHDHMLDGRLGNWMLGNQDVSRVGSRLRPEWIDSLHMLSLLLPGTAFTYYGEELGMMDTLVPWEQTKDVWAHTVGRDRYLTVSRDRARTPFQWDNSVSAGFTSSRLTWLPVNSNYQSLNLKLQQSDKKSHYSIYRRLVATRQESSVEKGRVDLQPISSSIISFSRTYKDKDTFIVVINLGGTAETVSLKTYNLPKTVKVHTASGNSNLKQGAEVAIKKLEMQPFAAVVLTTGKVKDYTYNRSSPIQLTPALFLGVMLSVLCKVLYH